MPIVSGNTTVTGVASIGPSSTNALVINSNGYVTKPNNPKFLVYQSTQQDLAVANTKITGWNTIAHQTGTGYSTSNSRYTAPVAGVYLFTVNGWVNNNTECADIALYKNGTRIHEIRKAKNGAQPQYTSMTPTTIIWLDINDYVEVYTGLTTGTYGTLHVSSSGADKYSWWSGTFLG